MAAPARPLPKPKRPRKRKPARVYVVADSATEDTEAAAAAVDAWLTEPPRSV